MAIFRNTLTRLLRNKLSLFTVFFLAPLFIGLLFGLFKTGRVALNIGFIDQDCTRLTEMLRESIGEIAKVHSLGEEEIRSALAQTVVDCVLVAPPGFTAGILAVKNPQLDSYSILGEDIVARVSFNVEGFIGVAKGFAATAQGDEERFYRSMEEYHKGLLGLQTEVYGQEERNVDDALAGIGILALAMMLLSTFSAISLIREREERTFYRVMASPRTLKGYMLENILCFFIVLLCQAAVMMAVVRWLYGMYLGPSLLSLYLVMAVFALLCVAMGIAFAAFAKTARQASTIASIVIAPMGMLSGLFWPRRFMPALMQTVGRYLPPTWLVDAARKVMSGDPLLSAGLELVILLGFSVVFFLLGTWQRVDVAK